MNQLTKTLYNIAMDVKIEEKMELDGIKGPIQYKEAREKLKRTFGLTNLLDMPLADIIQVLSVNPQKAKEIYHV